MCKQNKKQVSRAYNSECFYNYIQLDFESDRFRLFKSRLKQLLDITQVGVVFYQNLILRIVKFGTQKDFRYQWQVQELYNHSRCNTYASLVKKEIHANEQLSNGNREGVFIHVKLPKQDRLQTPLASDVLNQFKQFKNNILMICTAQYLR